MKHKDEQIHKLKYHTTLLRQANQNDYYKNPVMAVLAQATVQYTFSVTSYPLQLEGNMALLTFVAYFLLGYLVNCVLAKRINTLGVMQ